MDICIKRIFDPPTPDDGVRVLVDRLWPRGVRRDGTALDLWLKEVGPSTDLRRWFGHEPARWTEFQRRYRAELEDSAPFAALLDMARRHPRITLLYGAKDQEHNQAVVLRDCLIELPGSDQGGAS